MPAKRACFTVYQGFGLKASGLQGHKDLKHRHPRPASSHPKLAHLPKGQQPTLCEVLDEK